VKGKLLRWAGLACVSLVVYCASLDRAHALALDDASLCVDASGLHFDATVSGQPNEIIFRITADASPFVPPVERFAVNFDGTTGEITRLAPVVETLGEPPLDRWQDGPVGDFVNDEVEPGVWRLTGTLPHGADPIAAGDEIWGIALRFPTVFSGPLPVASCDTEPAAVDVPSALAPLLDGRISSGEWDSAARLDSPGGYIALQHDDVRLYVLINMLDDDTDDPAYSGGGFDQFWLMFDVDGNQVRTPGVDRRYRLDSGTGNLRYETFCEDCLSGFNPPSSSSFSARAEGFNCFLADDSATFLPSPCNAHRIWELGIDLEEIRARETKMARLGYLVQSSSQDVVTFPANLDDLGSYLELQLQGPTAAGSLDEDPFSDLGFEVIQAIQDDFNSIPLVADKPTAVRIFLIKERDDQASGIVSLKGSRDGIDLPGSPLVAYRSAQNTRGGDLRSQQTVGTWGLQEDWTKGFVQFDLAVRRPWIQTTVAQNPVVVPFLATETPTWWTVPVNLGSAESPILPSDNFMQRAETATLDVFPVSTTNFVRRPELVTGLVNSGQLKDELNELDAQALLAWTLGLLFTGQPPFPLPDAIVGVTSQSLCSNANCTRFAGGSSDPTWLSGNGRVVWAGAAAGNGDMVFAHELNHILDKSTSGTWGRHAPGCGATGIDPNWPLSGNAIDEWGLRVRDGRLVLRSTPDLMSYCTAFSGQVQWISEYRWQALLDEQLAISPLQLAFSSSSIQNTASTASATGISDTYYIRGRVFRSGEGEIDPVRTSPGTTTPMGNTGTHALRVTGCAGEVLSEHRFTPAFVDVEGEPQSLHPFLVRLPAAGSACAIQLVVDSSVLAERLVTPNPPSVRVLSPNGGEAVSGEFIVSWQAGDADGDELSFTVLYSPDDGTTWRPVAGGVTSNSISVDAGTLPASETGRIRVIATDGVNTRFDDSDGPFTVQPSAPRVAILGVAPHALVEADTWLELEGAAHGPGGERLEDAGFTWFVDGEPVGLESHVALRLTPGAHEIRLEVTPDEGPPGAAAIEVTAFSGPFAADPTGDAPPYIDLLGIALESDADEQRIECELTVATGSGGLVDKSEFVCHLDFDDEQFEAQTGCDADDNGLLDGVYRLGTNGVCETADLSLKFRPGHRAECTGAGSVACSVEEFGADGASDTICDGEIAGVAAAGCRLRISAALDEIGARRDERCGDSECLGGRDSDTGAYPVYVFAEARLPPLKDRSPDTDDGEAPDAENEVRLILLPGPPP